MTDSQAVCAKPKCGHTRYSHENADLSLGKCRYSACRCRAWLSPTPMRDAWEKLVGAGQHPLPPDDEVYSSGAYVLIPRDPPSD